MRDFYLWLPWTTVIGGLGLVGWHFGGLRLALIPICFLGFLLLTGFWVPLMMTVYLVTGCTILCILIGIPLGIWSSRERHCRQGDLRHLRPAANVSELHLSHPGNHAVSDQRSFERHCHACSTQLCLPFAIRIWACSGCR